MNIEDYDLYDFLTDDSFRAWAEGLSEYPDVYDSSIWQSILEANPEKRRLAQVAIQIIRSAQYQNLILSQKEKLSLWKEISRDTYEEKQKTVVMRTDASGSRWRFLSKAAVIFIPLLTFLMLVYFLQEKPEAIQQAQEVQIEKRTQNGQKLQITFTDGTQVKLNSDSKLTYKHPFSPDQREVFLEGEAFFEVAHDPERPFIVHTGSISTRVLGTSFNIRTYPKEDEIKVAVVTGKVMVEKNTSSNGLEDDDKVVLQPSEMAAYDKKKLSTKVTHVDIDHITAWNENILIFNDASFTEVIDQLERWYGVEFHVERKEPVKKGFNGSFRNKSLEHVLEGISYTSDFQYEIQGDTVRIK